jgi:hypothetical protein
MKLLFKAVAMMFVLATISLAIHAGSGPSFCLRAP